MTHGYEALKRHFARTGTGFLPTSSRTTTLPSCKSTHRLVLQLRMLRLEEGVSVREMADWYKKLFPADRVSQSRLNHCIEAIHKEAMTTEDVDIFLDTIVDFDEIDPILKEFNLTRDLLLGDTVNVPIPVHSNVSNHFVLALDIFRGRRGLSLAFVLRWVKYFLNNPLKPDSLIKSRVLCSLKLLKKMKRARSPKLDKKLREPLFPVSNDTPDVNSDSIPMTDSSQGSKPKVQSLEDEIKCVKKEMKGFKRKHRDCHVKKEELNIMKRLFVERENERKIMMRDFENRIENLCAQNKCLQDTNSEMERTKIQQERDNEVLQTEIDFLREQNSSLLNELLEKNLTKEEPDMKREKLS